ncbi:hypothetical protein QJT82_45035, partial [Bradyrhizobium sp. Mp19]|nr:hypothetical protein [Bradyrhizobium sp. Mp19]
QFNRVDPDNRLVAAELERRWEAALKDARAAEEALARLKSPQAIAQITVGNKALNDKVVRLSGRLPEIWTAPSTTDGKRKALLRCLIDKVILDRGEHDAVRMRIVLARRSRHRHRGKDARQLSSGSRPRRGDARTRA